MCLFYSLWDKKPLRRLDRRDMFRLDISKGSFFLQVKKKKCKRNQITKEVFPGFTDKMKCWWLGYSVKNRISGYFSKVKMTGFGKCVVCKEWERNQGLERQLEYQISWLLNGEINIGGNLGRDKESKALAQIHRTHTSDTVTWFCKWMMSPVPYPSY